MAKDRPHHEDDDDDASWSVGGMIDNPLVAAAIVGGAIAAGAGAFLGARALARRNAAPDGRVNPIMATAITAHDVTGTKARRKTVEGIDDNLPLDGN